MMSAMDRSVLELVVGGLPFPHGGSNGEWRYRHAVRPEGATPLDHQAVSDFLAYEEAHGRDVTVVADPTLADWTAWRPPTVRPNPGAFAIQCCSNFYPDGCSGTLVCHGMPTPVASPVIAQGALLPATEATGRDRDRLAAGSTWGEPPDYFEHVMMAHGRCTAPEAVAASRYLGRDLVPSDLGAGYRPAVRFYFAWETLASRPDAVFDGVHPVKIRGRLRLDELAGVVVHAAEHDVVDAIMDSPLRQRIIVVDATDPRPHEWAAAACDAVAAKI
jgi:hypothetical protein